MNIKAFSLAAITAAASITFAPAQAANYRVDAAHKALIDAVTSTGVSFTVNPGECWGKNTFGWYKSSAGQMVICQERKLNVGVEVPWTAEDLDTIRHEAQHLTQDCMDGKPNNRLDSVYKDPIGLAKSVLTVNRYEWIIKAYSEDGASKHVIAMELEAFSVAKLNDPAEQVSDIKHYCF
jgi:hypothetical protein